MGAIAWMKLLGRQFPQTALVSIIGLAIYAILVLSVWYFAIRRYSVHWSAVGLKPVKIRALLAMLPTYAGLLCLYLLVLMPMLFLGLRPPEESSLARNGTMTAIDYWWLFLLLAIAAPIAEEIFFRGMLYSYLRSRMHYLGAVLLSATLFALIHLIPFAWPMLLMHGIVLALVTERCKSIYPAIVLHAINNFFVLTLSYASLNWFPQV
jgi:hypothetical protein